MFEELPVLMVGCGTLHVAVITGDSQDKKELPVMEIVEAPVAVEEHVSPAKDNKKRSREEFEEGKLEEEKVAVPTTKTGVVPKQQQAAANASSQSPINKKDKQQSGTKAAEAKVDAKELK
jgi:hypothetical protein